MQYNDDCLRDLQINIHQKPDVSYLINFYTLVLLTRTSFFLQKINRRMYGLGKPKLLQSSKCLS